MSIRNLSERLNRLEQELKQSPPSEIIVEFVNSKREAVETLVVHLNELKPPLWRRRRGGSRYR